MRKKFGEESNVELMDGNIRVGNIKAIDFTKSTFETIRYLMIMDYIHPSLDEE